MNKDIKTSILTTEWDTKVKKIKALSGGDWTKYHNILKKKNTFCQHATTSRRLKQPENISCARDFSTGDSKLEPVWIQLTSI